MVPVKKIVAFLLMLAIVGSLSITTTGCGGKKEEKKTEKKEPEKKP
jgi:hypothetical protein